MKVVHYSRTPLAAAPYQIWKCLSKYTDLDVRLINETYRYPDGRFFPRDLVFHSNEVESAKVIKEADIIHIHNYLPEHLPQLIDKSRQRVIATFHSVPRQGTWKKLWDYADERFCIDQPYQKEEYKLPSLPTLFDIHEFTPQRKNDKFTVIFAPTNQNPINHPASKGYDQVFSAIRAIRSIRPHVNIDVFHGLPYLDNLRAKSGAHIIIDDVVESHNTYHLTSLEAMSLKVVCISSCKQEGFPNIYANTNTVYSKLLEVIDNYPEYIQCAAAGRTWMETNWDPKIQVNKYLELYKAV